MMSNYPFNEYISQLSVDLSYDLSLFLSMYRYVCVCIYRLSGQVFKRKAGCFVTAKQGLFCPY